MSIAFRHPTLEDREWITELYHKSGYRGCEASFVNLYLWGRGYGQIAQVGDYLIQFIKMGDIKYYAFPAGSGDLGHVIEELIADAREYGHPMRLLGVSCDRKAELEALYPGRFRFTENRASFDYLYDINRLADLGGKKLQSKRNHCNRFEQNHPDWTVEPITPDNLHECVEMSEAWFAQYDGETSEEHDFRIEKIALGRAFEDFEALGLEGLILKAEGQVMAFTMGNRIQKDTFDVNFEKAYGSIQGAYPIINREFSRYIREKYPEIQYLNREDDMGLPGLRKAKESYHPDILLCKATAELEESL